MAIAAISSLSSCQEKTTLNNDGEDDLPKKESSSEDRYLEKGDQAAQKLMGSLGSKLKAALKSGGPVHALKICEQVAQPSTSEVSDTFEGMVVSRVSLKARNPKNKADALDSEVLTVWEKQLSSSGDTPADQVRYKEDDTPVFYRPIITQDVCLTCHGDPATFSAELSTSLAEKYPGDKATGYSRGQLRGAFRVEFDAAKAR